LTAGAANALPSGTAVTIGTAATTTALLNTGGFAQTISSLTIYATAYTDGNPTTVINLGTGTLGIHGDISLYDSTGSTGAGYNQGAEIDAGTGGTIDLGGVARAITVAGQGNGVNPGDFVINAIIANGGIDFTGNPSSTGGGPTGMTLGASAPNTYAGGTTVNAGTLSVASTTTLGASTGALILNTTGNVASAVILYSSQTIGSLQTGTLGTGTATVNLNGTAVALTVSQTASTTFAGAITGSGRLTKAGAGSLTLSGRNTYTGTTTVQAGALIVGGSISGSTTVQSGGTLGGTGAVGSVEAQSGGDLEPGLTASGPSLAALSATGFTWDGGAKLLFDLSTTGNASAELSLSTGVLTEGAAGAYTFDFLGGGTEGQTYDLINYGSTTFTSASQFTATDLDAELLGTFTLTNNELSVQVVDVPEPSGWAALAWGAGLLCGLHRYRRAAGGAVNA
jgi:autotransporter-associated beta strand protein